MSCRSERSAGSAAHTPNTSTPRQRTTHGNGRQPRRITRASERTGPSRVGATTPDSCGRPPQEHRAARGPKHSRTCPAWARRHCPVETPTAMPTRAKTGSSTRLGERLLPRRLLRLRAVYQDRPDARVLSGQGGTQRTREPAQDGLGGHRRTRRDDLGRLPKPRAQVRFLPGAWDASQLGRLRSRCRVCPASSSLARPAGVVTRRTWLRFMNRYQPLLISKSFR